MGRHGECRSLANIGSVYMFRPKYRVSQTTRQVESEFTEGKTSALCHRTSEREGEDGRRKHAHGQCHPIVHDALSRHSATSCACRG